METPFITTRIAKYLVILILVAFFVFALYWLWQRQPRRESQKAPIAPTAETKKQDGESKEIFEISPKDHTVLAEAKFKLRGKTSSDSFVAIFSNSKSFVAKSDNRGEFEQEIITSNGLNLVKVATISKELKEESSKIITWWLNDKGEKAKSVGSSVYAGSIKSIFDTLLTILVSSGEKSVSITANTEIELPASEDKEVESTKSSLSGLRVGDYLIALGDETANALLAKKIQIVRKDKPQITKQLILTKILTGIRQNLFSAKNIKDDKILEFQLTKNSQVSIDGKDTKSESIQKDKNAFIFFASQDDKNLVDLIYILP